MYYKKLQEFNIIERYLIEKLEYKVSISQIRVFSTILAGIDRPARIAKGVGVTRQAITHTINDMVQHNWIVITPSPKDKRAKVVGLTDAGREIAELIRFHGEWCIGI